jgi:plasmid maintenance system antidote protein VapI
LTAPDYVLYNHPEIRKFNIPAKDWPRLSKAWDSTKEFFGNIRKTDAWSAKHNALKEIELNGVKKKILVPKEVELTKKKITTKDNKEVEVAVRLKKLTGGKENEWVDVDNKNDIYIKQSDGTFVNKVDNDVQITVSPTPDPPVQTSNRSSIASDGTIEKEVEIIINTDDDFLRPLSPTPAPPVQTSNRSSIASDGTI